MPFTFRFRWVPFIAALLTAMVGVALGNWQTRRANDKQAIETKLSVREASSPLPLESAAINLDDLEFRRVVLRGKFDTGWPLYLENMPYDGQSGFYLLMPMRLESSGQYVLVARGWLPRDLRDRTRLPQIDMPQGIVQLEGRVMRRLPHAMQLGQAAPLRPGAIVQNITTTEVSSAAGIKLLPLIVEQTSDSGDKLVRDWPRPSSGMDRNRGYAVQWYGLAAAVLLFFIVTGFRREKK